MSNKYYITQTEIDYMNKGLNQIEEGTGKQIIEDIIHQVVRWNKIILKQGK